MRTKNKMKNYLKLGILLFGVFFFLTNCKDEYISEKEEIEGFSFKRTSLQQLTKLKPIIENVKKLKPKGITTKSFDNFLNLDSLNVDQVIQITDLSGNSTYTFKIEHNSNNHYFENLHLVETPNGYIGYILSYKPNEQWYNNCINENGLLNLDMANYQGDITKYSLDRDIIWTTELENKNYQITECTYSMAMWCDEPWGNGDNEPHVATLQCTNPAHLYPVWTETCVTVYVGGGSDESDNDNTNGGTSSNQDDDCNDVSGTIIVANQPISGIGTGCAPNNTISIQPNAEALSRKKECKKINDFFQIDRTYRQKLQTLRTKTNEDVENSISIHKDSSLVNRVGDGINDGILIPTGVPSPYIMYAHTHDSYGKGNGTLSVFSMADLIVFANMAYRNGADEEFVAFLATDDDTEYALTINNPQKLIDLFYDFLGIDELDLTLPFEDRQKMHSSRTKVKKLKWKYFNLKNPNRKLKEDSTEPQTDLKEFLKFMEEADMGVTLFESNDTFTNFDEVSLKPNDSIKRKSCN